MKCQMKIIHVQRYITLYSRKPPNIKNERNDRMREKKIELMLL